MSRFTRCIYCSRDTRVKKGDHVVPARFGRFENELRFLHICRKCNQKIGTAEEQLIRCTPETLALHALQPPIQRHKRGIGSVGAAGAGPPEIWAELDGMPVLSHLSPTRAGSVEAHPQLVLVGVNGEKRSIRLHPDKPSAEVRDEMNGHLGELAQPIAAHVHCPEDQTDGYSQMLGELGMKLDCQASRPAGSTQATGVAIFQVTKAMFRAIAKIGFHYFLTQTTRYVGDEPAFRPIREFILDGLGDHTAFFREWGVRNDAPTYRHVLRAREQGGRLDAFVSLFCHAEETTGYEVHLGTVMLRPTWEAAHEYVCETDTATQSAGYVRSCFETR